MGTASTIISLVHAPQILASLRRSYVAAEDTHALGSFTVELATGPIMPFKTRLVEMSKSMPTGAASGALPLAASTAKADAEVWTAARTSGDGFLAPRFDNLPKVLRDRGKWVAWLAEGGAGEKPRKVPYNPTLLHSRASSTDPETWGTFAQAEAAYAEGGRTGVGIVLDGDGLVGVDIDHCVKNGVVDPTALALMSALGAEYVELSPSGTGLRAFGYSDGLATGCKGKYNGLDVELYSTGRYLTVTGESIKRGAIVRLKGFNLLADRIRADRQVNPDTGEVGHVAPDKRNAEWVRRVLSGDAYHDSLCGLAASLVASGMVAGATVNLLYGLIDNSSAPHDDRWQARRKSIPGLVSSAVMKYAPQTFSFDRIMGMEAAAPSGNNSAERDGTASSRYKILSASELANATPLQWIIRGLYPATGLVALYGQSGSGKSFLALDMAISIAGGAEEWYGMRVVKRPVTYCVLEGEAGMGKRVSAWGQHYDKPLPDTLRFVTQPINLLIADDVQELARAIQQAGGAGGVIILDTLNRAAPAADENSSKDMGAIIAAAKQLQDFLGGLVVLVHHTGKVVENGMRGHSSLFAAMDGVIAVSSSKEHGLSWTVAKSKDDATGAIHAFRLEQVITGIDDEGEDVTSCVALPIAPPLALRKSKRLGQNQQTAKDVLQRLFDECSASGAEIPLEEAIQAVADQIETGPRHKRQRAKEAIEALTLKSLIDTTDTHVRPLHRPT